jgi:hypothetical protein
MSIVTRGYGGSGTIMTRGLGRWSSILDGLREIFDLRSHLTKVKNLVSRIPSDS